MNREVFEKLIALFRPMGSTANRRDAFERAMRVVEGGATVDEAFGVAWGERTWGDGAWGEAQPLGITDGKKL